jgi:3-hydroxyacyl-CoA dehydrogenase
LQHASRSTGSTTAAISDTHVCIEAAFEQLEVKLH